MAGENKKEPSEDPNDIWLYAIIVFVVLGITTLGLSTYFDKLSDNTDKFFPQLIIIFDWLVNPYLWTVIGIISSSISIICIAIIIFSLVRMREIQNEGKEHLNHEINTAFARNKEAEKNENPRWHYILTLIESPNDSDWRVAIIEADTMLDEVLTKKGMDGETLSDKLEQAKSNGYATIQNAWDAHLVRNKIAHQGSNFSLTQIEGRRVIRMFQNFFEELGVI